MNKSNTQSIESFDPAFPTWAGWLQGTTAESSQCETARCELGEICAKADEKAHGSLQPLADLFSTLLDLAECLATEDDSSREVSNEILEFIQSRSEELLNCLSGNAKSEDVEQTIREAHDYWGEHLDLLGQNADLSGFEDAQPYDADDDSDTPSVQQIDAMLAAIGQTNPSPAKATNPNSGSKATGKSKTTGKKNKPQSDLQSEEASSKTFEDSGEDLPKPPANLTLSSDVLDDIELREAYLDDANRCLVAMEQVVLKAEDNSDSEGCVLEFCRQLHTLKGASASVGLSDLANYLHEVEEWLSKNDSSSIDVEVLLSAVDSVRLQIGLIENPGSAQPATDVSSANDSLPDTSNRPNPGVTKPASNPSPSQALRSKPRADFSQSFAPGEASVRVRASQLDKLMDMLAELIVLRNQRDSQVGQLNTFNDELIRCSNRLAQFRDQQMDQVRSNLRSGDESSDQAIQKIAGSYLGTEPTTSNAIAEVTSDLSEISRGIKELYKPIAEENQALSSFIRHFRQELIQLRRVPVVGLFQKLQRSARDAAKVEGKKIQVKLVGQNIGLEQSLQEQLYDPLLHLVRNAVGHGVEEESTRQKNGKNPIGTITLEAKSSANLLVISIIDDGKGLDYDALRRRGFERGLLSPDRSPTTRELANLIFHPGFSTRDKASEVAGRGIGMDVVAGAINQLQGRIEIDSHPGSGTTMRVSVPLKSGIEHTMVFMSGGQLFALPMQSIASAQKRHLSDQDDNNEIRRFGISSEAGLVPCELLPGQKQLLLETEPGQPQTALVVDDIVGPEEVVVRSLPRALFDHPFLNGMTLSGDGDVVLLLDGNRLSDPFGWNEVHTESISNTTSNADSTTDLKPTDQHIGRTALVVDDSLSARKALVKRLRQRGFETEEAGDGMEALEQLRRAHYDILLTDLDMPRLSGLDLLADLDENESICVPTVVVSNRNQTDVRKRVEQLGALAFINKPVTDEILDEVLSQVSFKK